MSDVRHEQNRIDVGEDSECQKPAPGRNKNSLFCRLTDFGNKPDALGVQDHHLAGQEELVPLIRTPGRFAPEKTRVRGVLSTSRSRFPAVRNAEGHKRFIWITSQVSVV